MEFLSHVEKNSVCDALPMNNTSGLNNTSGFGFPFNAGTRNSSTVENWIQFYRNNVAATGRSNDEKQSGADGATGISILSSVAQQAGHVSGSLSSTHNSEATSVTTKASSACLSVNGATGKVSKKRSRASRRAPTTLLTTDASNFRAMVQQFTGIPEPPFWSGSTEQRSQGPLLGHAFSLLPFASFPGYPNFRPQQYPPFQLDPALREDINSSLLVSSQGHPSGLLDYVGLNSSYSPVFSSSITEGPSSIPYLGLQQLRNTAENRRRR